MLYLWPQKKDMETLNVQLINPKAKVLLMNLEEMNLIRIELKPTLSELLAKIRCKENEAPTLEEITEEVEMVRQKRYAEKMQNNH